MFQKFSYASIKIDPVVNGFSSNEVKIHFHICYYSIIPFGIRGFCSGHYNTSHVNSLDRFIKSVVDKVKIDVCVPLKYNHQKENNMKIQSANKFVQELGMGNTTTCVYHLFMMKMTMMTQR